MHIAIQTSCLHLPIRQALHTAARLGAEGVQFDLRTELAAAELTDTAHRHLRKMLDDLNLRVASAAFPTRRGYADSQDLDRRIEATAAAMRAASRLGARVMIVALGVVPAPDSQQRATLVEALAALAGHANRWGVMLAGECSAANPAEVRDLLAELPEGFLGVDLNPAELIRHGRSPGDFARQLGGHVLHVYANDAVRMLGGGGAEEVQLGRGSTDFPELLGQLEEFNYRGWITIQRSEGSRIAEDIGNAVMFLRAL